MIDLDSTICEVHGKQKQGAAYGYTRKLGYHPLLATLTGTGEIIMSRMRKGSAGSGRGAVRFVDVGPHQTREPHLPAIADPAVLISELERVRAHYNSVRLHEAIGYVTPNDEHQGRGETIRAARRHGLTAADQARRAWHRSHRTTT